MLTRKSSSDQSNILALPFREALSPTSFDLPSNLPEKDWREIGVALGRMRGSMQWWLGDWWKYEGHGYGDRKAMVESEDWHGPQFQTCMNAAAVCIAFKETSRRREVLPFIHHAEVAGFCGKHPDIADRLLDWCQEPIAATGKPHTILQLREEVRKAKRLIDQGWTQDQIDRRDRAANGECVVASMREVDGKRRDDALLNWAEGEGRLVRIDRQSAFGNPFIIPDDGERPEVVAKFTKFYWPHKTGLINQVSDLAGKVLACWCYPEECHGDTIAETVNRCSAAAADVSLESDPFAIAELIADHDG
jgi:hypothetical protein